MIKNIFLGLGPMSIEIIDAISDFAKKKNKKIMLICSRNQIETSKLGGGYVNNFSTKEFSKFVKSKNNKNLIMCRDHGGPYKNDKFRKKLKDEIIDCKKSLLDDIVNDFKIIHIDTSQCKKKKYEIAQELINFCEESAKIHKKEIFFEFGCEDHGVLKSLNEFKKDISFFSKIKNRQYMVCQTGSHVRSIFQVGQFDFDNVIKMKKISKKHGILLKEHNCDYLDKQQINVRKKFGVDAINIAPELGFLQSYFIFSKAKQYGFKSKLEKFIKIVIKQKKWRKWNYNNENDFIKFLTSAHYYYSRDEYKELKFCLSKKIPFQKNFNKVILNNLLKYY
jgi:hypothetical protein